MFGWLFDVVDKVVDAVVDFVTPDTNKTNNNVAGRTQQPSANKTTSTNTNRGNATPQNQSSTNNNKSNNKTNSNSNTNKTNNNVAGRTQQPSANVTTSTNTNRGNATPQNQSSNSKPANTNTFGGTKIQNTVLLNNKEYAVYKLNDGTYYIIKDGEKKQLYGGMQLFTNLQTEDPVCVNITDENLVAGSNKIDKSTNTDNSLPAVPTTGSKDPSALPPLPSTNSGSSNNTSSNSTSSSTKPSTNSGTGSTGSGTTSNKTPSTSTSTNTNTNTTTVTPTINKNGKEEELVPPKFASAEEAAKKHGIDYNYDNILGDYNKQTNAYYDQYISEQERDRTKYLQASNNYANRIIGEYLDGYANAAATAAGRGTQGAVAFMTDLNSQAVNTANDFGMLQTVNNLEAKREAELANNPYLATEYYNKLGTYLSDLSTAEYAANVKKYVDELDAYEQTYAADRLLSAADAKAASAKYAGLVQSKLYDAQAKSAAATSQQKLYNYYLQQFGGDKAAANAFINSFGIGGNS